MSPQGWKNLNYFTAGFCLDAIIWRLDAGLDPGIPLTLLVIQVVIIFLMETRPHE